MPRKLLIGWLGVFAIVNAARAALSIQQASALPDLPTQLPPIYVAVGSLPWAIFFAVCGWGVYRQRSWVWRACLSIMGLYLAHQWFNRLAFSQSSEAFQTLGALAITSTAAWGITFCLVWFNRRRMR